MILKGFKEKSNRKYLNKLLLNRDVNVTDTKIKSLGVIIHLQEVDDFELFRGLAKNLNIHSNQIKVIAFSSDKKNSNISWDICFCEKDFGWKGELKNLELQAFVDTKFDALISYYTKDEIELKLMTAKSKALFKIGIFQTDMRLNDLIIKTHINEFDVFKKELFKYLTILNKIKNEQ
ncbi:MAG: hypothetical protein GW839_04760 [Flavobacteriales bacterium]|nr:hypothetical protein [Flavobacteriia bacterium]NCP05629.1 hypothetical protein [Flavobacteriales bacterium]PIV94666.1 MAG: hypothetical protein COW44_02860 [Flavobacteriaceae bacterium CG17_big_fil_post_rev_8_21_14_2_50_33_15]PIY09678.1 MAG: hypothetical protein COZ17_12250 [Flavobacteriaceae bacterium CG_4_10_14_3_um_filter_33_47]PJB16564.1 MAG: hypothetical protein CO117_14785 [Flavobacteriaceae bacterium CG_4_9_14_3_um_filter_33_16]